jgi:hypothetical membrane protein
MRKSTLGGVLGPIIFSAVVIVAALMRPDYSHVEQFISELGATGTENAAFMNFAGFALGGLLIASLGVALYATLPRRRVPLIASVLVGLFGLGVAASGVISCDIGCPQGTGTTANLIHNTIAPIAFLCLIVASFLLGIHWWRDSGLRSLALYSIGTGVMALVFLALLISSLDAREITGLWQRLLLMTLFSWCIVIALRIGKTESGGLPSNKISDSDS